MITCVIVILVMKMFVMNVQLVVVVAVILYAMIAKRFARNAREHFARTALKPTRRGITALNALIR